MLRKDPAINSVFPLENNREEKFTEPPKLGGSIIQNPKVLRYDWQSLSLAEPRDNKNFFPPNGNLHKSSYVRLGRDKQETGISETHMKLKEINKKDDYTAYFPRRSTLNVFSFNLTEDDERKDTLRSSGFQVYPDAYGSTDYRTTSKVEYPLHFPMKPWPRLSDDKPWLFYRKTLSYRDEELSMRDCRSKFYDEDFKTHNDIAAMKMDRHRSYDPISKKFTDPCEIFQKCK